MIIQTFYLLLFLHGCFLHRFHWCLFHGRFFFSSSNRRSFKLFIYFFFFMDAFFIDFIGAFFMADFFFIVAFFIDFAIMKNLLSLKTLLTSRRVEPK